ncbi:hypothetical protein PHMEG_0004561 [Phytophthora megakarya]|uniref:Uncharacterized protein n=1 Tax=Phytophthora megakarya TaxID=4795 RepID=A0A225WTJ0_9STRA|nr:hypothetical protein PHMEG_0004561 [Phytophthora megakarya]
MFTVFLVNVNTLQAHLSQFLLIVVRLLLQLIRRWLQIFNSQLRLTPYHLRLSFVVINNSRYSSSHHYYRHLHRRFYFIQDRGFVIGFPEGNNLLLGLPWLAEANTDVDCKNKTVRPRGSSTGLTINLCPRAQLGVRIAGGRQKAPKVRKRDIQMDNLLFYAKA